MTQKVANKAEDLKEDLFSSEVDAELSSNQVNRQPCFNNETYQERLERLEGDKESLVLQ
ncbi:liprin-beta-2b isoform X4, partial [Tachysurus ichikawai]